MMELEGTAQAQRCVALTRSDARQRPGGPNYEQWLAVNDAVTGEPIALVREVMRADGSVHYRHAMTGRKLKGTLEQIIRSALVHPGMRGW